MNLFNKIKDIGTGIGYQLNTRDNGKTFSNRQGNRFNITDSVKKSEYVLRPDFEARIRAENPQQVSQTGFTPGEETNAGGMYRGVSLPGQSNIQVRNGAGVETLVHEGLHSAWQNGANKQEFRNLLYTLPDGSDVAPEKKYMYSPLDFIKTRYANYNGQSGGSLDDPMTMNETHSSLPEFYYSKNRQLPENFRQYYDKYFDTNKTYNRNIIKNTVNDMLDLENYHNGRGRYDN